MDNKIALILPYFGKLPNWFYLWLESAGQNKEIDWLIYTDDERKFDFPKNVYVHYMTWKDMKEKVQTKFDFRIALDSPYKLCDFKPTYGEVFSDDLKGYNFWGYCDPDCIWGNIRKFITDDILSKYDRILIRGHLSIYRNNQIVNSWYKTLSKTKYYKIVYQSNDTFAFDEGSPIVKKCSINGMLYEAGIGYYNEVQFDDIFPNYSNFISDHIIRLVSKGAKDFDFNAAKACFNYCHGTLMLNMYYNGKLYRTESMYIHLQKRKMENLLTQSDDYWIIPNKFVDKVELKEKTFNKLCGKKIIYIDWLKVRLINAIKKAKKKFYG